MRITLFVILSLWFTSMISAQDRPIFFPEDIEPHNLQFKCLCKPGVSNKSRSKGLEFSFLHVVKSTLNEEQGFPLDDPLSELTMQTLSFRLRLPVVNKEGFKVIAGLYYRPEHYDFKALGPDYQNIFNDLNEKFLNSSGFELLLTKSYNEKYYSILRARSLFNGDYSGVINLDKQYAIHTLTGMFGIKKDEDTEWGFGLNLTHSFRKTLVVPFFLFNKTFNERWGIESSLPALFNLRYNLSEKSILLMGLHYNSRSYSILVEDPVVQIYNLNHSEIRALLALEQQLRPWIWLELSAGFQYNFSTDFEVETSDVLSFQVEPGSAPFFKFGLFISPPDSFLK